MQSGQGVVYWDGIGWYGVLDAQYADLYKINCDPDANWDQVCLIARMAGLQPVTYIDSVPLNRVDLTQTLVL